jgi:xanthine phosphoribosyltransferase
MDKLQERVLQEGRVLSEQVLKVDSFLNHQVDPQLILEAGQVIADHYRNQRITKVLTIEASGIHISFAAALALGVPFVYAKKKRAITQSGEIYAADAFSFTRQETYQITVSKPLLTAEDRVLIVDDILAEGAGVRALLKIIEASGATLVGVSVAVEKSFQKGRQSLDELGVDVYPLVRIASMSPDSGVTFLQN